MPVIFSTYGLFVFNAVIEMLAGVMCLTTGEKGLTGLNSPTPMGQWWAIMAFQIGLISYLMRNIGDANSGKILFAFGVWIYHVSQIYFQCPSSVLRIFGIRKTQLLPTSNLMVGLLIHILCAYEFWNYISSYGGLGFILGHL